MKCKDVFNAFMLNGAKFVGNYDIPFCPTTAKEMPTKIISYCDIGSVCNLSEYFIHFYKDDFKFDGKNGIWNNPKKALEKLKKSKGVITPDFSTYQDMPASEKIHNTFRMRAFGYWLGKNGLQVINNIRWGTAETFCYCFDGLPKNDIYFISTVGCARRNLDKRRFFYGLDEMINRLNPKILFVYESSSNSAFKKYEGIRFVHFTSQSAKVFNGGKFYE